MLRPSVPPAVNALDFEPSAETTSSGASPTAPENNSAKAVPNDTRAADERRSADADDETPPAPRKERLSAEAIGFWAASGTAAWATVAEFVPVLPKAIAGTLLATVASVGAGKAWLNKRRDKRERREDR